tara:strand:+ start:1561 stop:1755 length:195 start_codon:yes stop_codon:yes gene_type:complete
MTLRELRPSNGEQKMKRFELTIGSITTKEKAQEIADQWRNPRLGYHTEVIRKKHGFITRLVINN